MSPVRILHCADFHVGMRFTDYQERETLSTARFEAVERVVRLANERACDLLVISGDLFDRISMHKVDVQRVAVSLAAFEGQAVLVLPGNHDYISPDSTLWRTFRDAAGDHIQLLSKAEPYDLRDLDMDIIVYPAPCDSKHSDSNRIGWVPEGVAGMRDAVREPPAESSSRPADGLRHIGIAHGSIEGVSPDFDGRYFPMTRKELEAAPVDLWLLGHSHVTWPEIPDSRSRILNPGTPEPDGFDCTHAGHAFLIDLPGKDTPDAPGGEPRIEIVETGAYRFRQEAVRIHEAGDTETLLSRLMREDLSRTVLRLHAGGRIGTEQLRTFRELTETLREHVLELDLRTEGLYEAIGRERILQTYAQHSFAARLLLSLHEEDDRTALEEAWDLLQESRR